MEKLLSIFNFILEKSNREKLVELKPEMDLRYDIGFDSLDLAELTVRIEKEYGIDIFEDGIVTKVAEVIKKLNLE